MTLGIPQTVEEITPAWLEAALERPVVAVQGVRIGEDEGFTGGGLFRLAVDGDTVVAKLSPSDPVLRAAFAKANAREVAFYQLAAGRELPVPECQYGAFDPATGASVLLIEDMGAMRSVSFQAGCSAQDAAAVVDALACIHGAFWQGAEIGDVPALALLDEFDFTQMWAAYPAQVAALLPDVVLPEWFLALGGWLARDVNGVFGRMVDGPQTVVHRDAQVDNVLFGAQAVVLDWQFMGRGKGVHDLAFFLISSLTPEVRRGCEDAMIARYHAALVAQGIGGYTLAVCRRDYVQGAVWRLFITAMATTQLDNSSAHKRAWRRADLARLLAFCEDHGVMAGAVPL